jgi:hypothetical protein
MDHSAAIRTYLTDTFDIDPNLLPLAGAEQERFVQMRAILIRRLEELIAYDMDKLLWILYRIDVSETKVRQHIAASGDLSAAEVLADLIIARQIEKIKTRAAYSTGDTHDWSFDV